MTVRDKLALEAERLGYVETETDTDTSYICPTCRCSVVLENVHQHYYWHEDLDTTIDDLYKQIDASMG